MGMNTEDDEFARIEREQAMRGVPDPIHNMTFHNMTFHNMTFHNGGKQVGALDFNGPEMTFSGDADESAKVFFDFIAKSFKARLDQERADERKACAKVLEDRATHIENNHRRPHYGFPHELRQSIAAIRARCNT